MALKVGIEQLTEVFQSIGYKNASNWTPEKFKEAVEKLAAEEVDDADKPEDPKLRDLFNKLVASGGDVEVTGVNKKGKAAAPAKGGKKDAPKGKPAAKASANGKKATREAAARDGFGAIVGSNKARMNATLSDKPMKMDELLKKAKLPNKMYNHLNRLAKEGYVKKTDAGFALTANGKKAQAKSK